MDDTRVIMQQLDGMDDVLKGHSESLKELSKAFTVLAVQNEQIQTIITRMDIISGHVENIKVHQAQCPKPQIKQLWFALGVLAAVFGSTLLLVIHSASK